MWQRRVVGIGILGVVALLVGAACTAWAGTTVSLADQGSDAATLELAQRYIARDGLENADLLPGQLPGDLPFSLPLPPNSRIVGSVVRHFATRVVSWEIILDAPNAPPDVTAFYNQALTGIGWTTPSPFPSRLSTSGFLFQRPTTSTPPIPTRAVTPNPTSSLIICPPSGDVGVNVTARPMASGLNDVHVRVDAFGGACTVGRRSTSTIHLPALTAPHDIAVLPKGSGDTSSDATAQTEMSAGDLEDFYAQQLMAAGWVRVTGDVQGTLAWSLWTVPDQGGMQGYLSVLEIPGKNIRDLHLQIGSASTSSSSTSFISVPFTDPSSRPSATPGTTPAVATPSP